MANYIETLKTQFNISEVSDEFLMITLNSSSTKLKDLKEFCKLVGIKKISNLKKPELVKLIIDNKPEERILSEEYINDTDDESDNEDDTIARGTTEGNFSYIHYTSEEYDNYIKSGKIVAVMFCSQECDPCMKLKPKFIKIANDAENDGVKFAIVDIDEFEKNIRKIPESEIDEIPAIRFYKNGEQSKTIISPSISVIKKTIQKLLIEKVGVDRLKEICGDRGLLKSGKKCDIQDRIEEDDRIANKIGYHIHTLSKEQLINYLETELKIKSQKHTEMEHIDLIKKVRKSILKKEYKEETNYEKLCERFNNSEYLKELKKMTIHQIRIIIDNGWLETIGISEFNYKRYRDIESGEMIKALSKNQIIEKIENQINN